MNEAPPEADLVLEAGLVRALLAAPVYDAIGVACSYLLWASTAHPDVLRRVLHEPVVREGFRGESLMSVLRRAAR